MPGSGSAEAEAAATYLREQVPAFGNPSSHRTPEASCHINISFSVSETADGTDFDREYLRQYVDLRDYLSLATNYSFCLCKPWLPLCSHAVGKMGHPLYMIAAHRRGEFPGELLQPPVHLVTAGSGSYFILPPTRLFRPGTWDLFWNLPSHSLPRRTNHRVLALSFSGFFASPFSLLSAQCRGWDYSLLPASLQSPFHTGAGLSLSIGTHSIKHGPISSMRNITAFYFS